MLLMIDNYDCFTYNLVQYLGELGEDVRVSRNDEITVDEIAALAPERHLHLARPVHAERGRRFDRGPVKRFAGQVPILGVCLGHQAIGQAFGGQRRPRAGADARQDRDDPPRRRRRVRGPARSVHGHALPLARRRARSTLPDCLEITAWTDDGEIMGLRHKTLAVEGVQFHPESIATEHGHAMLKNFLGVSR